MLEFFFFLNSKKNDFYRRFEEKKILQKLFFLNVRKNVSTFIFFNFLYGLGASPPRPIKRTPIIRICSLKKMYIKKANNICIQKHQAY